MTHTHRGLTAPDGTPSGALYGAIRSLRAFLIEYPSAPVVIAVDAGTPEIRTQALPEYKQSRRQARKEDPSKRAFYEEYIAQVDQLQDVMAPLGVVIARVEGYEADDVIGALCLERSKDKYKIVLSGDEDMLQLVNRNTHVYRPHLDKLIEKRERGFLIRRAIEGDKSDGIQGVYGVGPKKYVRVMELVPWKGNLDQWLIQVADTDDKICQAICNAEDIIRRNILITDLRETACDCNDELELEHPDFDLPRFIKVCKKFAFQELLMRLTYYTEPFEKASTRSCL